MGGLMGKAIGKAQEAGAFEKLKPEQPAQTTTAAETKQAASMRARRRGGMRLLYSQERVTAQNQALGQQDQLSGPGNRGV